MSSKPILTLLVLTEDSSKHGHDVIRYLVTRMLEMIVPEFRSDRVRFEPPEKKPRELALQPNTWRGKSPDNRRKRIELFRAIANTLMECAGFVLFHFDGDKKWSEKDSSQNYQDFKNILCDGVRKQIEMNNEERKSPSIQSRLPPNRRKPPLKPQEIEQGMSRLLPIVPFYSIEAWLYQNTKEAIKCCQKKCQGNHIKDFKKFEEDRASLDEIEQPKENDCIKADYNLELARTFSRELAETVYDLQKSFFHTVDRLKACEELFTLLKKTAEATP